MTRRGLLLSTITVAPIVVTHALSAKPARIKVASVYDENHECHIYTFKVGGQAYHLKATKEFSQNLYSKHSIFLPKVINVYITQAFGADSEIQNQKDLSIPPNSVEIKLWISNKKGTWLNVYANDPKIVHSLMIRKLPDKELS